MDWSTNDIPVFVYAETTWNNENLRRKTKHGFSSWCKARTTLVRDRNADLEDGKLVATLEEICTVQ